MNNEQIQSTIFILLGCLFVFALIRELICWYFKINKRVHLQEQILAELVSLNTRRPDICEPMFIDKTDGS